MACYMGIQDNSSSQPRQAQYALIQVSVSVAVGKIGAPETHSYRAMMSDRKATTRVVCVILQPKNFQVSMPFSPLAIAPLATPPTTQVFCTWNTTRMMLEINR